MDDIIAIYSPDMLAGMLWAVAAALLGWLYAPHHSKRFVALHICALPWIIMLVCHYFSAMSQFALVWMVTSIALVGGYDRLRSAGAILLTVLLAATVVFWLQWFSPYVGIARYGALMSMSLVALLSISASLPHAPLRFTRHLQPRSTAPTSAWGACVAAMLLLAGHVVASRADWVMLILPMLLASATSMGACLLYMRSSGNAVIARILPLSAAAGAGLVVWLSDMQAPIVLIASSICGVAVPVLQKVLMVCRIDEPSYAGSGIALPVCLYSAISLSLAPEAMSEHLPLFAMAMLLMLVVVWLAIMLCRVLVGISASARSLREGRDEMLIKAHVAPSTAPSSLS